MSNGHNGRYMGGLDGLRALAVLAVLAYHLDPNGVPGGLLGVGVFFVLSGYLITDILAAQWKRLGRIDLKDFWMRRVRRLLPAMLLVLVVSLGWIALFRPAQLPALWGDGLASILYINNWWLIFHHVSYFEKFGPPSPLGHLWSLAVEEQFYLLWPFLLYAALRFLPRRSWLVCAILAGAAASALAMALLYLPGTDPSRVYYGTDTRAFALLIGAALALLWPSRDLKADVSPRTRRTLDLAGTASLLLIVYMVIWTNQYQPSLYRGGLVLLSLATAVTVAVIAHPASRLAKVLSWNPLRWIGVRSYGIYLWHYPVVVLTSSAVDTDGFDPWRAALQAAISVALAALSWHFVEKPIRYRTAVSKASYRIGIAYIVVVLGVPALTLNMSEAKTPAEPLPAATVLGPPIPLSSPIQSRSAGDVLLSEKRSGEGVVALGDSVMLDAEPFLKEYLPGIVVEAKIGRQMYEMPAVVTRLQAEGKLGQQVILQTGTNGPFAKEQLESLLRALGPDRQVILINTRVPRPWESVVNATLKEVAADTPNAILVDWYAKSAGKDAYFYPDGVHLNPDGAKFYASLLVGAHDLAKQQQTR